MLTIRTAQKEALRASLMLALAARAARYLRTHHSAAAASLSDTELDAVVSRALARAQSYGMKWESSLVSFAALALEIGPAFDQQPRIRAMLTDPSKPPDERIGAMIEATTEADWQEARALGVAHDKDPIVLVPVALSHVPELTTLLLDMRPAPPLPPDDVGAWVATSVRRRAEGRHFAFVITTLAGVPAGICALRRLDGLVRRAVLSCWMGRAHQNKGYATVSARRVVAFGFERLRLAAIYARVEPKNATSLRVVEKLGAQWVEAGARGGSPTWIYRLNREDKNA